MRIPRDSPGWFTAYRFGGDIVIIIIHKKKRKREREREL